ncbi:MAG: ester cyclase [Pseudomarimonas sp.]
MDHAEIGALLSRHVEAENAHDLEGTLATLHPDCRFEDVAFGQVWQGHEGAARYYRQWWDAFGLQFREGESGALHWAGDGTVIAEGRFVGRHLGPFQGLAPTHRDVDFRFVVVIEFRDRLMAGERFFYDRATLARQLGGAPAWMV